MSSLYPTRHEKAQQIVDDGLVLPLGHRAYSVRSQSDEATAYRVDLDARSCVCPDYDRRQADCKHILAAHICERIIKRSQPRQEWIEELDTDFSNKEQSTVSEQAKTPTLVLEQLHGQALRDFLDQTHGWHGDDENMHTSFTFTGEQAREIWTWSLELLEEQDAEGEQTRQEIETMCKNDPELARTWQAIKERTRAILSA